MNRISLIKHLWKTSFEMIIDKKFNLTHLMQYEAKAYFVDKKISNLKKMRVKIHIDFLMNYNNINIWFIWIFSQRKVIRTRNITFDENN